ncbi:hypothetical protein AVEN_31435-1 [Araneus ventricosus]|uniref:Uncharacterized protein n=1 Tax=Araneus ventricosus TaxID=182803 RepID=A0A4Y2PHD2_ARAVE|nr:hypothetical protein AVEN_31435-1 [Araneus ventricosus]
MKETYETLKHMLSSIEYSKHICADLKVIAVLVGLQAGYTKFCCFLCQWDSRDRKKHYIRRASHLSRPTARIIPSEICQQEAVLIPVCGASLRRGLGSIKAELHPKKFCNVGLNDKKNLSRSSSRLVCIHEYQCQALQLRLNCGLNQSIKNSSKTPILDMV